MKSTGIVTEMQDEQIGIVGGIFLFCLAGVELLTLFHGSLQKKSEPIFAKVSGDCPPGYPAILRGNRQTRGVTVEQWCQGFEGELRTVIVLRKVRTHDMLQVVESQLLEQRDRLYIGKMPPFPPHTAFELWWIRAHFEHMAIMIAFDNQRIAAAESINNMPGGVAQISQHTQPTAMRLDTKLYRLPRIMGHGNRINNETFHRKARLGRDPVPQGDFSQAAGEPGTRRKVDR